MSYTLVTAFFDLDRENWKDYRREINEYKKNAERVLSLYDNFVIFVEEKNVDFVKECRKNLLNKTLIIVTEIKDLYYYKYLDQITKVMNSEEFKRDLVNPMCPEVCKPLYNVVCFEKAEFLHKVACKNPFNSNRFCWIDFGIHEHMLHDNKLSKKLFNFELPENISLCCRRMPSEEDKDIQVFFKSNSNRLCATIISGGARHLFYFKIKCEEIILSALEKGIIDCEQSIYTIVYLNNPKLFRLYYGDWDEIITNY